MRIPISMRALNRGLPIVAGILLACSENGLAPSPEHTAESEIGCAATLTKQQSNPLHGPGTASWLLRNTGTKSITGTTGQARRSGIVSSATDLTTYPFTLAVGASRTINVSYTTSGTGFGFVGVSVVTTCNTYADKYTVTVP
jgi:hypothetical protein